MDEAGGHSTRSRVRGARGVSDLPLRVFGAQHELVLSRRLLQKTRFQHQAIRATAIHRHVSIILIHIISIMGLPLLFKDILFKREVLTETAKAACDSLRITCIHFSTNQTSQLKYFLPIVNCIPFVYNFFPIRDIKSLFFLPFFNSSFLFPFFIQSEASQFTFSPNFSNFFNFSSD